MKSFGFAFWGSRFLIVLEARNRQKLPKFSKPFSAQRIACSARSVFQHSLMTTCDEGHMEAAACTVHHFVAFVPLHRV